MSGWTLVLQLLVLPAVVLSLVEAAYLPLALVAHAHRPPDPLRVPANPFVSVIVPAFDEGKVLRRCVESILADRYLHKEVVLVDDGSRDDTWEVMQSFAGRPGVVVVSQANAGKAAALNRGIARSHGSILMFVDADGVFSGWTVRGMLRGFDDPRVGAVCGNDAPVNLDRLQPRLLTLLTHVTAMVRRALAQVNCLTIVSGNCGAVRRDVVDEIGGERFRRRSGPGIGRGRRAVGGVAHLFQSLGLKRQGQGRSRHVEVPPCVADCLAPRMSFPSLLLEGGEKRQ